MKSLSECHRYIALTLTIFLMLAVTAAHAQDAKVPLPEDKQVIKGQLPNGLTYYVRNNGRAKVELRLIVNAGSILEDDDQQGLAHFMEHMNFNGTVNFKKNELISYLQTIGVQFGADINANTDFDQTIYRLSLPADSMAKLEKGFQVIEDWAHNALLTDADIDAERGVVLEESRLDKGAEQRIRDQYLPEMLSGSRYALRMQIGKDSIIRNFKYEALRRYYHDWYRPDLMAVIVVGDIDTSVAVEMIRKHFSSLTNPQPERSRFSADIKVRNGPDARVVKDKELTIGSVSIIYPFTKTERSGATDDYLNSIKRSLILSMINQRIADVFHSKRPQGNSNFASFLNVSYSYEAFGVACEFPNEYGPGASIRALTKELKRIGSFGFTESEYDLAKGELKVKMDRAYAERNNTSSYSYADEYINNFTSNTDISGEANHYSRYAKFMPSVELNELDSIAASWIQSPDIFVLVTAPDQPAGWPSGDGTILKITHDGFYQSVERPKEKEVDNLLINDTPEPGKIVSRSYDGELDATTYRLSNGVVVTIKKTEFKSDEILLKGIKAGGESNYNVEDKNNFTYLEPATQIMGFGNFKSYEIYKTIADKNIKITTAMNSVTDNVSGESNKKDIEQMMQLLYIRLTKPRKDYAAFKSFVQRSMNSVEDDYRNPEIYFADTLTRVLYNNAPLAASLPRPTDFELMDIKRVLKIYKDEFSYAEGYHFFIVGNVDTNIVLPLVETYLGSLRESGDTPRIKDNGLRPVAGIHNITVHKGKEQKSMIRSSYYGSVPFSEELVLKTRMLTDILNIKVMEHLREDMGAIYTGGFTGSVSKEPYGHYSIDLNLPCGPEYVDKLIEAANKEIRSIRENGPELVDIKKVKNQLIENHKAKLRENTYWAAMLEDHLFWNRSTDRLLKYESLINKITQADIQQTAKLLFDGKNEFTGVLMPE